MFGDDGDDFEIIPCASCGRAQVLLPGDWCPDCASFAGALPVVPAVAPSPELEATWQADFAAAQAPLGPNSAAGPAPEGDDLDIPY